MRVQVSFLPIIIYKVLKRVIIANKLHLCFLPIIIYKVLKRIVTGFSHESGFLPIIIYKVLKLRIQIQAYCSVSYPS